MPLANHSGRGLNVSSHATPKRPYRGNEGALVVHQGIEPCYTRLSDVSLQPDGPQTFGVMRGNRTHYAGFTNQCLNHLTCVTIAGHLPGPVQVNLIAVERATTFTMSARLLLAPQRRPGDQPDHLVPHRGFEPRFDDSKSPVLPVRREGNCWPRPQPCKRATPDGPLVPHAGFEPAF